MTLVRCGAGSLTALVTAAVCLKRADIGPIEYRPDIGFFKNIGQRIESRVSALAQISF